MEREPKDRDTAPEEAGRPGAARRARVEADLAAYAAEQQHLYGGIDELTLARHEAGLGTAEERARVEQALRDHPALRECLEASRDFAAGREIAPADASRQEPRGEQPWAVRTERPETGPGKPR